MDASQFDVKRLNHLGLVAGFCKEIGLEEFINQRVPKILHTGIEDFRWHDLRHTWASWHVQNGTSLQELQQLGGWSSFEMVLPYAHLSSEHLKHAAQRIQRNTVNQQQAGLSY